MHHPAAIRAFSPAVPVLARTSAIAALDEGREALRVGAVTHIPADCEVFAEGDAADVFFKIVSGTIRTCRFKIATA